MIEAITMGVVATDPMTAVDTTNEREETEAGEIEVEVASPTSQ
jgi:hypothetical protein